MRSPTPSSGAGLPEVTRAAGRALDASVIVLDAAASVLAVACESPEDERAVVGRRGGRRDLELQVAQVPCGQAPYRPRGEPPPGSLVRARREPGRARGRPGHAAGARDRGGGRRLPARLLRRRVTDRENIVARASELGGDLSPTARACRGPRAAAGPEDGDWRGAGCVAVAERGARGSRAAWPPSPGGRVRHDAVAERAAGGRSSASWDLTPARAAGADEPPPPSARARAGLTGVPVAVGKQSRRARSGRPPSRRRRGAAGRERRGGARRDRRCRFEETGAYRLLLPAMSEDPAELQRFFDETVAPLIALRRAIRDRARPHARDLSRGRRQRRRNGGAAVHPPAHDSLPAGAREGADGLDVGSTDGRERLGLGLKAMRVLGMCPPGGPAHEAGRRGRPRAAPAQGPLERP